MCPRRAVFPSRGDVPGPDHADSGREGGRGEVGGRRRAADQRQGDPRRRCGCPAQGDPRRADRRATVSEAAHAREKADVRADIRILGVLGNASVSVAFFARRRRAIQNLLRNYTGLKKPVEVAGYGIKPPKIAAELVRLKEAGVDVTVYLDRTQAAGRGSQLDVLRAGGVRTFIKQKRYLMHNKYMIIDGREVITGSYNFSTRRPSRTITFEVIKDSSKVVQKFEADFRRMLKEAGPHPDAETAKKIEEAATKIAAAVETAKAKAEAWAKAEAAWAKALSEADVDATGAAQVAARRNAARTAMAGARAAEEAWTKAATAEEAWANAEHVWRRPQDRLLLARAVDKAFANADRCAKIADATWKEAEAREDAAVKASDEAESQP